MILGAGAIGCAIGGRLFEHGHDVVLVAQVQLFELPHQMHAEDVVLAVGHQHVRAVAEHEHLESAVAHQRTQLLEVAGRRERH